jgi:hypothetical protein
MLHDDVVVVVGVHGWLLLLLAVVVVGVGVVGRMAIFSSWVELLVDVASVVTIEWNPCFLAVYSAGSTVDPGNRRHRNKQTSRPMMINALAMARTTIPHNGNAGMMGLMVIHW